MFRAPFIPFHEGSPNLILWPHLFFILLYSTDNATNTLILSEKTIHFFWQLKAKFDIHFSVSEETEQLTIPSTYI